MENPLTSELWIIDFGLARHCHPSHDNKLRGTEGNCLWWLWCCCFVLDSRNEYALLIVVGFFAPELRNGQQHPITTKCDIFSAGVFFACSLKCHFPYSNYDCWSALGESDLGPQELRQLKIIVRAQRGHVSAHLASAFDLLIDMLEQKPSDRIRACDALMHPFICKQHERT